MALNQHRAEAKLKRSLQLKKTVKKERVRCTHRLHQRTVPPQLPQQGSRQQAPGRLPA